MALAHSETGQLSNGKKNLDHDEYILQEKIEQLREWMKKQRHLPKLSDEYTEKLLKGMARGFISNIEKAMIKIENNFALRRQLPEIFSNLDVTSQEVRDSLDMIALFPVTRLTPEGYQVIILKFNAIEGRSFMPKDIISACKRFHAIAVARMTQEDRWSGHFGILDLEGVCGSHIVTTPWPTILRFIAYVSDSWPCNNKRIYLINAPRFIDTVINIIQPAIRMKIKEKVDIFKGDVTNINKHLPGDVLPLEYGGAGPSIDESNRTYHSTLESMRDFLLEEGRLRTNELKRPRDLTTYSNEMFGSYGSFRKLNID